MWVSKVIKGRAGPDATAACIRLMTVLGRAAGRKMNCDRSKTRAQGAKYVGAEEEIGSVNHQPDSAAFQQNTKQSCMCI